MANATIAVKDTFTDTAGTLLSAHTGETGAAWTLSAGREGSAALISAAGRVYCSAGGAGLPDYTASGVPATADYDVVADLTILSAAEGAGITTRWSSAGSSIYLVYFQGVGWIFKDQPSGLSVTVVDALVVGATYRLKLEARGATITAYVDNVRIGSLATTLTTQKKGGVTLVNPVSASTGMHVDNFHIVDAATVSRKLVVFDGDSITYGYTLSLAQKIPAVAMGLRDNFEWVAINSGVNGATVADMIADAATEVDAYYSASNALNACVMMGGTNDIGNAGQTKETAYARIKAYHRARKSVGWFTVAVTITPRVDQQAKINWINRQMRLEWPTFSDALVDLYNNPKIEDSTNATYYFDTVHPTAAGDAAIAEEEMKVLPDVYHVFTVRSVGVPQTGLFPTWLSFNDVRTGAAVTPQPLILEVGGGRYRFSWDAGKLGDAAGMVDAGSVVASANDRYIPVEARKAEEGRTAAAMGASAVNSIPDEILATPTVPIANDSSGNVAVSDVLFDDVAAGGSTTTVIWLGEAHDDAKGATYVGNTLVWETADETFTALIISYGPDPGSGASVVTVEPAFDSAPQAGDTIKIVRGGAFGAIVQANLDAQVSMVGGGTSGGSLLTAIYNSTGLITNGNIIVSTNVRNGVLPIPQGHTFTDATALQITQPDGTWPDLANYPNAGTNGLFLTLTITPEYTNHAAYSATVNARITFSGGTCIGTFAGTNQAVAFRPGTVTATLVPSARGYPPYPYQAQVWAVSGTNNKQLFNGMALVTGDIRS